MRVIPLRSRTVTRWLALALLGGAGHASRGDEAVTFQDHVRPIFESVCNNCHNPDKKKGGLDLSSYAAMMAGGSSGEIVASGDAPGSRLYACVTKAAEPVMPPSGDPLKAEQLAVIKKWIEGGLLDAKGGVAKKAKKPAFSVQMGEVALGKPEGPPPMPEHLLLEPVVVTPRAAATAAMASSPWAPLVAISGQRQVLLYNTDTLELAGILPFPEGAVESLIFSRNGSLVVAGTGHAGKSGKVVAWEVKTGKRAFEIGEERDSVLAADLSADQATAVLGNLSKRVKLFDTATGELIKDIKKHTDWVTAVQFSPDGVLLATGDRAGNLYLWEGKTGNEYFTLPGHTAAITAVSWRADGNILASASEDGTIRLWEMNEGKEVKKWNAHNSVQSLAFTHDGRLVSCGRDNHAKIWDQEGKQITAQNQFTDLPLAACFTHDGARFMVGDWSGRISVWNSADATPVGDLAGAPPSLDQRLAALAPEISKSEHALETATATLGSTEASLASAQAQRDRARQSLASFQEHAATLEKNLGDARASAESLLARLSTPAAAAPSQVEAEAIAAPDLATAQAQADDLRHVTAFAKASLAPMGASMNAAVLEFSGDIPRHLTETHQAIQAREAEIAAAQEKKTEAGELLRAASAALEKYRQASARWQAAKINATLLAKKDELADATAELEAVAAELTEKEKPVPVSTGSPAPDPDDLKALEEQKAALEAKTAALTQDIEAETARYLATLPQG